MTARTHCPVCTSDDLRPLSLSNSVDYLRCAKCGHVWTLPKYADTPVHHVTKTSTPPPKRPETT